MHGRRKSEGFREALVVERAGLKGEAGDPQDTEEGEGGESGGDSGLKEQSE